MFTSLVSLLAVAVGAGIGLILGECAGFAFVAWRVPGSVRFEDGDLVMGTNNASHYLHGFNSAGALCGQRRVASRLVEHQAPESAVK